MSVPSNASAPISDTRWRALIRFGAIAAMLATSAYLGWQWLYPSVTIRYRLTLEVEADDSRHVGSGVIQVAYARAIQALGSSRQLDIDVQGEAVAVDLGPRGILFALLKGGEWSRSAPEWIVPNAFGVTKGGFGSNRDLPAEFARLKALTGRVSLTPERLPLLVRFRDVAEPGTVERVDPGNLAASFGEGVRLARATIEMTRDSITTGIEKRLPWLTHVKSGYLDGQFAGGGPDLSNILRRGDFKKDR